MEEFDSEQHEYTERLQTRRPFFMLSPSKQTIIVTVCALCAIVFGAAGYVAYTTDSDRLFARQPIVFDTTMSSSAMPTEAFPATPVEARAVAVYDLAQKKMLYAKNEGVQLPLASLTKLMTAYVAHSTLKGDSPVVIPQDRLTNDGDPSLVSGDVWSFKDLLGYTLMQSSNDGAHAIAGAAGAVISGEGDNGQEAFIAKMNAATQQLGMKQTYFKNETGLDTSTQESGAYGSARDVAILIGHLIQVAPDIFEDTDTLTNAFTSTSGATYIARNTNQYVGDIPALIGSKTGYTDLAGGNLAIVFDAGINHPIAVVVLGSSAHGRFDDAKALVDASLQYFTRQTIGQEKK